MHILHRLDFTADARRFVEAIVARLHADECRFGIRAACRSLADAAERNRRPSNDAVAIDIEQHRDTGHREIPQAPRELHERVAVSLRHGSKSIEVTISSGSMAGVM